MFGSSRGCHGLVEIPVLFDEFKMFCVSALLFLVFLEPNAVCEEEVWVGSGLMYCVSEAGSFSLGFGSAGRMGLSFVEQGRGKIRYYREGHFTEVSGPLGRLAGLPMRGELLCLVVGWCKSFVPVYFAKVSFLGWAVTASPMGLWSLRTPGWM